MVKLLTLIYDSAIDETLMELLEELGVEAYTKIFNAHGLGGRGRKENTPVWPGTNHLILIAIAEPEARRIIGAVRRLQATYRLRPGITILLQDVEVAP